MSINKNTMEVTRKGSQEDVQIWGGSMELVEHVLNSKRLLSWCDLSSWGKATLNDVYRYLHFDRSKEGLTLGWKYNDSMAEEDLFTWAFCADGTVEITFHNLKDISDLYKTEEELA